MFIVFITRIRDKVMLFFRLLLFVVILLIFLGQLLFYLTELQIPENDIPHGPEDKPMRVENK